MASEPEKEKREVLSLPLSSNELPPVPVIKGEMNHRQAKMKMITVESVELWN